MPASFEPATIELLREIEEVEIETRAAADAPLHRTVIWVVVDDADRVFIRSVRGAAGRWYREAAAHPPCVIHAGGVSVAALAVPAADDDQVEACSREVAAKYGRGASVRAMLRPEVLPTTLRLEPR